MSVTGPIVIDFDVTESLPEDATAGKKITLSGWAFFSTAAISPGNHPVAMTLLSGGSYDKRYHHAVIPGHSGYSAAEHLAAKGTVVLLLDHLGVGGSARLPQQSKANRHICALAAHAAVSQFHDRLATGTLHPALPAMPRFLRVGGGHSMGAMQIVTQQATHGSFDAIMVLGYTAQGVHFVLGGKKVRAADYVPQGDAPDYNTNDRAAQRGNFHWNDVPEAVMLADDALAVETPREIGFDSIRSGIIAQDAARITVPVLFAQGEQDVSPDPHAEAVLFRSCPDFSLYILPRSAHCQSFASTRHLFWDRMHGWAQLVA